MANLDMEPIYIVGEWYQVGKKTDSEVSGCRNVIFF